MYFKFVSQAFCAIQQQIFQEQKCIIYEMKKDIKNDNIPPATYITHIQ